MVEMTCQKTGLKFFAETRRTKNHPTITAWLQKANSDGWYNQALQAIEWGNRLGFTTIEEYVSSLTETEETAKAKQETDYSRRVQAQRDRKQYQKTREENNALLRSNGYRWQKYNAMGALDDFKDGKWELIAPDGGVVSVAEALRQIAELESSK